MAALAKEVQTCTHVPLQNGQSEEGRSGDCHFAWAEEEGSLASY